MNSFPDFMKTPKNQVADTPDDTMAGFAFDGSDDVQIVFWECEKGGTQPEQVHDFWEYALVVQGTFDGEVDGKPVHLEPGDECVIPPGTVHSGRYSANYRAIDAFSARRVTRVLQTSAEKQNQSTGQ